MNMLRFHLTDKIDYTIPVNKIKSFTYYPYNDTTTIRFSDNPGDFIVVPGDHTEKIRRELSRISSAT